MSENSQRSLSAALGEIAANIEAAELGTDEYDVHIRGWDIDRSYEGRSENIEVTFTVLPREDSDE